MVGGLKLNRERIKARGVCAGCGRRFKMNEYKTSVDLVRFFCGSCSQKMERMGKSCFEKVHPNSRTTPILSTPSNREGVV
jgi:hypothetical protein